MIANNILFWEIPTFDGYKVVGSSNEGGKQDDTVIICWRIYMDCYPFVLLCQIICENINLVKGLWIIIFNR